MKELVRQLAISTGFNNVEPINGADNDISLPLQAIMNTIMGIIAAVCVIVIVIGGIQYMTSTGDPGKVKKAKDTILYGIIGLVIVILAAVIVNVVIVNILAA